MQDKNIIELFLQRNEEAIRQTDIKYRQYLFKISYSVLSHSEDSMECVNDTYLKAWNSIPPDIPNKLSVYLGKIVRNISLDRFRYNSAQKRFPASAAMSFDEITDIIPANDDASKIVDEMYLTEIFNKFLGGLRERDRIIFVKKYWHLQSLKDIAKSMHLTEATVKMSLMRSRNKLRDILKKEGISI